MDNLVKNIPQQKKPDYDYEKIANSNKFKTLLKEKKKFLIPLSIFFLLFYFTLPILTSYTNILNKPAIGPITWTWVYALAQFIMTWGLCIIYVRKATKFDNMAEEIIENYDAQGDRSL